MNKTHKGKIIRIIGTVVDAKFENHLPAQHEILIAKRGEEEVMFEVMAHNENGSVKTEV